MLKIQSLPLRKLPWKANVSHLLGTQSEQGRAQHVLHLGLKVCTRVLSRSAGHTRAHAHPSRLSVGAKQFVTVHASERADEQQLRVGLGHHSWPVLVLACLSYERTRRGTATRSKSTRSPASAKHIANARFGHNIAWGRWVRFYLAA